MKFAVRQGLSEVIDALSGKSIESTVGYSAQVNDAKLPSDSIESEGQGSTFKKA